MPHTTPRSGPVGRGLLCRPPVRSSCGDLARLQGVEEVGGRPAAPPAGWVLVYMYGRFQMGETFSGSVLSVLAQPFGLINSWNGG